MCWRDAVIPSTTTILLTLIVLLNTYLVILTARNKGTIIQDSGTFEVKLRSQLEADDFDEEDNSVEDFRNSLPHRPRYYSNGESRRPGNLIADNQGSAQAGGSDSKTIFNDILDHDASFKDDDIDNNFKKVEADVVNDKIEDSVVKSGANPKVEPHQEVVESKNELNEAQVESKPVLPQEAESPIQINEAQVESKPESAQEAESLNQIDEAQIESEQESAQKVESQNQVNEAQIQSKQESAQEVESQNQLNETQIESNPESAQEAESQNQLSEMEGPNHEIELDSPLTQNDQEVPADGNTNPEESEDSESGNLGEGTVPAITAAPKTPEVSMSPPTEPSDRELLQTLDDEGGDRTVVLLVSDYRSGSSLLGEMFNQNDDVFYLFEPLMGVVGPKNQKKFLERLMTCTPNHWGFLRRSRQSGCGEYHDERDETPEYRQCLKTTNRTVECLKYGITAAKFIRLTSIESIREFGILDRPNVFVVHSFRDPRGTINSRLSYDVVNYNGEKISRDKLTKEIVGEIADSLCWRYYNDSVFGDSLHKKYIRITYEDVCIDPQTNIERVYEMIGHPVPERVLAWFNEHTHAKSVSAENDKMGLERNAALTAVRWKQELSRDFICAIEHNCKELMDYLNLEHTCRDINM